MDVLTTVGAFIAILVVLVLVHELLFLVALAFWTWYRIHDAEGIQYTERPMDFALYRAILRGGELPPGDPWMSGFAISYYYLGYLIMAMVTALSGVAAGVGYHLAVATLAALTSGAAFTVALGTLWERLRPRVAVPLAISVTSQAASASCERPSSSVIGAAPTCCSTRSRKPGTTGSTKRRSGRDCASRVTVATKVGRMVSTSERRLPGSTATSGCASPTPSAARAAVRGVSGGIASASGWPT